MALLAVLALLAAPTCVAAFASPHGAYRNGALCALAVFVAPFAIAYLLSPLFPGDYNLGGAIIVYGPSVLFALAAAGFFAGATARHAWNALRVPRSS